MISPSEKIDQIYENIERQKFLSLFAGALEVLRTPPGKRSIISQAEWLIIFNVDSRKSRIKYFAASGLSGEMAKFRVNNGFLKKEFLEMFLCFLAQKAKAENK